MDKQGKHIPGHRNFEVGKKKSEWMHPDPEGKLRELAGTGQKVRGTAGKPGYKERVDCGETIGLFIDKDAGMSCSTTMATIHYSKEGAHIVPARPKR